MARAGQGSEGKGGKGEQEGRWKGPVVLERRMRGEAERSRSWPGRSSLKEARMLLKWLKKPPPDCPLFRLSLLFCRGPALHRRQTSPSGTPTG